MPRTFACQTNRKSNLGNPRAASCGNFSTEKLLAQLLSRTQNTHHNAPFSLARDHAPPRFHHPRPTPRPHGTPRTALGRVAHTTTPHVAMARLEVVRPGRRHLRTCGPADLRTCGTQLHAGRDTSPATYHLWRPLRVHRTHCTALPLHARCGHRSTRPPPPLPPPEPRREVRSASVASPYLAVCRASNPQVRALAPGNSVRRSPLGAYRLAVGLQCLAVSPWGSRQFSPRYARRLTTHGANEN